jgi:Domain of unknown function (DUF5666)
MVSKALLVVKSKVALAVLGVVLVGGGGTAVAVAATGGHVPVLSALAGHSTTKTADSGSDAASHAHTVSLEGVLKSYDATAHTISVLGNGDTSPTTIEVDSNTKVNGEHASALADLTKAVGHKVQVQATKQSNGTLLAWKITVEGATGSEGQGQGSGQGSGQGQQTELQGTVASVGATSFIINLPGGGTKTVTVSAAALFAGRAHKLSDLKVGDAVSVHGTSQGAGTVAAASVEDH